MIPPRIRSLRITLTLWYTLILLLITLISGAYIYFTFQRNRMTELDRRLRQIAVYTFNRWANVLGLDWNGAIRLSEERFQNDNPFILVKSYPRPAKQRERNRGIEPGNFGLFQSRSLKGRSFAMSDEYYTQLLSDPRNEDVYMSRNLPGISSYPLRTIVFADIDDRRVVQVGVSLEAVSRDLRQLRVTLLLAGGLLLLVASVGGYLILRQALRPMQDVVSAARRITADDLSLRLPMEKRRDEIGELIDTFNDMLVRLDNSVSQIRRFSGDVSHELRTPLTAIRGEIEVCLRRERAGEEYRTAMASILEETHRLEKIIDDLLLLSRLEDQPVSVGCGMAALDEILLQVFERHEGAARRKNLNYHLGTVHPLTARGEPILLERLLDNLVDNAIRYTPENGRVELSLTPSDGWAVLAVSDNGIGIPEEAIPHLYERFFVVDSSRSRQTGGTGLGLAIVKWIADSHGATLHLQTRLGEGTTFRVEFPPPGD